MTEKRYSMKGSTIFEDGEEITYWDCCDLLNELNDENKELKDLLKSMADRKGEIWLDNGQIIRLKRMFKGEWVND